MIDFKISVKTEEKRPQKPPSGSNLVIDLVLRNLRYSGVECYIVFIYIHFPWVQSQNFLTNTQIKKIYGPKKVKSHWSVPIFQKGDGRAREGKKSPKREAARLLILSYSSFHLPLKHHHQQYSVGTSNLNILRYFIDEKTKLFPKCRKTRW